MLKQLDKVGESMKKHKSWNSVDPKTAQKDYKQFLEIAKEQGISFTKNYIKVDKDGKIIDYNLTA